MDKIAVSLLPLLRVPVLGLLVLAPMHPAQARDCSSLVASVCDDEGDAAQTRRTLSVKVTPPAFTTGDRFPVEERSLLLNPTRHRLPPVDGSWRYYAMDGVVYRVDNATATVLEVIRDSRTWGLR